ncbi:ABC transporter permease [Chloroflexia bacterium SDU3-3]|nr:ABC transporter permease [Chloroflexia bacterium SDU3-3]
MRNALRRLFALVEKEVTQMLRDRRSLVLLLSLPLVQLFLFAYAVSMTVDHLPTAIVDQSDDQSSRAFIQSLTSSQVFDWTIRLQSEEQVLQALDRGQAKVGVIIPPDFAARTQRGSANVMILLDGSDSFSVRTGYAGAAQIAQRYAADLTAITVARRGGGLSASVGSSALPITTQTRMLYNPDQIDKWFIVPGLIGLILQTLAVQQVALMIVRDRETGAIEQILATPARPAEIVLSKLIPLLVLCVLTTLVALAVGVFWFRVPFRGSLLIYLLLSTLFIVASLGLGLLLSARAKTQWQAYQMSAMPMSLGTFMGGVLYPREAMPIGAQILSDIFPLTYFVRISRGIITKGVGMEFLAGDTIALLIYAVITILLASRTFLPRLD